jgi:hypothetical protein
MHGQLNYLMACEHIADLQRAAARERFARSAPRPVPQRLAMFRLTNPRVNGRPRVAPARDRV